MVKRRCRFRLAPKAGQCVRVAGYILRQELESHKAMQPRVLGLANHTHPAAFLRAIEVADIQVRLESLEREHQEGCLIAGI
jgi:hypothetical protein